MSYNYTVDKLQTHPYLGTWTKESREICRPKPYTMKSVESSKKKKKCAKGVDSNKSQKNLINMAVIQTVNKLKKEYERKLKLKQMGAQNQVPLNDIRKRSTDVQNSRNQSSDTTDKIVKLKSNMQEKLGKLKVATEDEIKADLLKEKHREEVDTLKKRMKSLEEVKKFASTDLVDSFDYKKVEIGRAHV